MPERMINLNTATAEELMQLPGIGPMLAERILAFRDTVGFFEEPSQIMAVSGIGGITYGAAASRLTVVAPAEPSGPMADAAPEEIGQLEETRVELATEEKNPSEAGATPGETISRMEEIEPEVKAEQAGEPILGEEPTIVEEATEAGAAETVLPTEHVPEETTEEAPSELSGVPRDVIEAAPPKAQERFAGQQVAPEVEEVPVEEQSQVEAVTSETGLSPAHRGMRPGPPTSCSWWRRLPWLWTVLLGGLFGLAFTLAVFSGINGSLDIGHSRAVVGVNARMDSVMTDIGSLQGDVDGLRSRLNAMEELTLRMETAEAALGELQEATVGLGERSDALEQDVAVAVEEIGSVSDRVEMLQDQAERTRSFFHALQALLNDLFGDVEGNQW